MCLYPKLIFNRKYRPNKKNNGNPQPIKDPRTKYVPVGCGQCMECRKQKSRSWAVRLHEEIRVSKGGRFVTFTFSEEKLQELDNEIPSVYKDYDRDNKTATLAIRRFLERWRKQFGKSLRHWCVTELGQISTERIHIHGIIWTNETLDTVRNIWQYGTVNRLDKDWSRNYVNERTINYIVKYVNKIDPKHKYYTPIILTSSGIGKSYLNRIDSINNNYKGSDTNQLYTTRQGIKMNLPIYYRNKLYTDEQKEQLWLNLLDTNTRYINGIKVDVSENENEYWATIKEQRIINKQLGYSDNIKDNDRIKYEKQIRNLKRLQRIQKLRNKE